MKPEDRVYQAYFDSKKTTLYFNEIKELSKLSDSSLANTLKRLTKDNIITKEKTKSNTFYKLRNKKIIALKFSELAMKKYEELNRGVRVPLNNFLEGIPKEIYTIIIFGTASRKQERKESDIDLLVVAHKDIELSKNKKKGEVISNHPISIFKCSIQDFIINKDDVIIQARKTGFPIYKEQNFYEVLLDEY